MSTAAHQPPCVRSRHSPHRVLLVDENTQNLRLGSILLRLMGFEVVVAIDGASALDHYERIDFDLVLLHLEMPGMDGYEAASQIRQIQRTRQRMVPILALTSHDTVMDRMNILSRGLDESLPKPLRADVLLRAIKTLTEFNLECEIPEANPWSLDADYIRSAYPMTPKAMSLVVELFRESCTERLRKIEEALAQQDADSISRNLHALKGSLAMFASPMTLEIVRELESIAKNGELAKADCLLLMLGQAIDQLQPTLDRLSQNLEDPVSVDNEPKKLDVPNSTPEATRHGDQQSSQRS